MDPVIKSRGDGGRWGGTRRKISTVMPVLDTGIHSAGLAAG